MVMQDFYQEHSRFGKQMCVQESDPQGADPL